MIVVANNALTSLRPWAWLQVTTLVKFFSGTSHGAPTILAVHDGAATSTVKAAVVHPSGLVRRLPSRREPRVGNAADDDDARADVGVHASQENGEQGKHLQAVVERRELVRGRPGHEEREPDPRRPEHDPEAEGPVRNALPQHDGALNHPEHADHGD